MYKRLVTPYEHDWTNDYWVDALGLNDALAKGEQLAIYEQPLYCPDIALFKVTAQLEPHTPVATKGIAHAGSRSVSANDLISLFNTVRVTYLDEFERPEQKYYRGVLIGADVAGINIVTDTLIDVIGPVATDIAGYSFLRGPHGEGISGHLTHRPVQMRQVGWQRRSRPGFHRGWVPNT